MRERSTAILGTLAIVLVAAAGGAAAASGLDESSSGAELYAAACAACHAADGRGMPRSHVGFDVPLPDFTDCDFTAREPTADWALVAAHGGPVRGFSELMPAFGVSLSTSQLERAVEHARAMCRDDRWPDGSLNLPRPLVTEKAYPEDEAVLELTAAGEGDDRIGAKFVYEQRIGPRSQVEIALPLAWSESTAAGGSATHWGSGVGDLAVAAKRTVHHDPGSGSIVSVTGELILPTGDDRRGFGKGTFAFEPFVTYGQILPADGFFQSQAGFVVSADTDEAEHEAFLRAAIGRSFFAGRWGRSWSPMVELVGGRDLTSAAETDWDLVPQLHVTLNRRQHVMLNVGVRTPLTDSDMRRSEVSVHVLWDWFDGGLLQGW